VNRRTFFLFSSVGVAGLLSSCGYHVGGRADLVPKSIQTIAIPAFQNGTIRYKLTDQLPRYVAREFITRTRFKIEDDPSIADAVLNGTVNAAVTYPTVYDPLGGKATSMQVTVVLSLTLLERTTGKVLYSNPGLVASASFDIAASNILGSPVSPANNDQVSAHEFFDESGPAFERVGRDVASQVVASVVENF
jgi:Lipopolysaccharide-assembly